MPREFADDERSCRRADGGRGNDDQADREKAPPTRAPLGLGDERIESDSAHAEHVLTPARAWFTAAMVAGVSVPTSTYASKDDPLGANRR